MNRELSDVLSQVLFSLILTTLSTGASIWVKEAEQRNIVPHRNGLSLDQCLLDFAWWFRTRDALHTY